MAVSADVIPMPNSEVVALRVALARLQMDNYALQKALSRATDERDHWRDMYLTMIEREAK